jgi:broad specificity phosphatase PhoE
MARIYLVRHGKASHGWNEHPDPGLDDLGREQANKAAKKLLPLGPLDIVTSPLMRTQETAKPLSDKWNVSPKVEPRVGEIATPEEYINDRGKWLGKIVTSKWTDLGSDLNKWRQEIFESLLAMDKDTVVFSHFIAINAVVGEAKCDDRVVSFNPDNGSVTVLDTTSGKLKLIESGLESVTFVG